MYGNMFDGLGGCLAVAALLLVALGVAIAQVLPMLWAWLAPIIHAATA